MRVLLVPLLVISVTLSGVAASAAVPPTAVINTDFPDPDVLQVGGTYYAYSTSSAAGRVQVASAPSPSGPWTVRGDALPTRPAWAGNGGFWAPDVSRRDDGRYLMYFTGPSTAVGRMCLGAATSASPTGPFQATSTSPLVCNAAEGGDIDPSSFVDTNGKRYLLYKNDGNAVGKPAIVWLQQVQADGVTFVGGRTELIRNDRPEEGGVIEAPVLVHRASQYVLFYSGNGYDNNKYFTSYAVSSTITGKYTKAYRPLMTTDTFDGAVQGPGGADVHADRIFFHGWVNRARWMYVAELGWANDYPVVRGSRVRHEAERGAINHAEVRTGVPGASQGAVVAKLDYNDSWVDITVYAPSAGNYTAHVRYAAGYGDAQHTVTVNGGTQHVLNYPDHGWDNWTEVGLDVTLRPGWNTLRFQYRSRWAELDHVELA
nr:family 43 glycosylhydrolase [Kibdelosporangium sp. MJ126-NF4]CEL19823.1 glycoside hydrolase, family 43 [Kibdelosporangium sp. MJ126-NF4]CTQ97048.1 glycoside hydrolase, family 43 [Kibdelosporangium sp. MJ126-NF4]